MQSHVVESNIYDLILSFLDVFHTSYFVNVYFDETFGEG